MKTISFINSALSITLASTLFLGCSSSDDPTTYAATGVIVDPYIVGAIMCEDENTDGVCDANEQLSTASDENGEYKFENALQVGSNIIIKTQGKHEGVTYNLKLTNRVSSATQAGITSPLTTLTARGLTTDDVATILNQAATDAINNDGAIFLANFTVTASDISTDPLSGDLMDKTLSEITDAQLSKIQASITTYALLKIMEGSTTLAALSGNDLLLSGTTTGQEVNLIARTILKTVSDSLNSALLDTIERSLEAGRVALVDSALPRATADKAFPEATVGLVIKVAVKAVDRLATVGYEACNSTNSTDDAVKVAAAISAVETEYATVVSPTNVMKLGKMLYAAQYRQTITTNLPSIYLAGIASADPDLAAGINSTATTFNFTASGGIE